MSGRTFAIGDVHGDLEQLEALLAKLPALDEGDSLVFLGDYLDRGPRSAEVVARVRALATDGPQRVVALRGNHEDAWLRIVDTGWPEFLFPRNNGCLETLRSYQGRPCTAADMPEVDDFIAMERGAFLPADVVAWLRTLKFFHEDAHALYVHAGIKRVGDGFPHPADVQPPEALLWLRDRDFFANYRGKLVVFGHTTTPSLPPELSSYTPEDPTDLWAGPACVGLDTGCGKGGFLTALELPSRAVYESR
jgi:serine/threonine protein phosphatase 1